MFVDSFQHQWNSFLPRVEISQDPLSMCDHLPALFNISLSTCWNTAKTHFQYLVTAYKITADTFHSQSVLLKQVPELMMLLFQKKPYRYCCHDTFHWSLELICDLPALQIIVSEEITVKVGLWYTCSQCFMVPFIACKVAHSPQVPGQMALLLHDGAVCLQVCGRWWPGARVHRLCLFTLI